MGLGRGGGGGGLGVRAKGGRGENALSDTLLDENTQISRTTTAQSKKPMSLPLLCRYFCSACSLMRQLANSLVNSLIRNPSHRLIFAALATALACPLVKFEGMYRVFSCSHPVLKWMGGDDHDGSALMVRGRVTIALICRARYIRAPITRSYGFHWFAVGCGTAPLGEVGGLGLSGL